MNFWNRITRRYRNKQSNDAQHELAKAYRMVFFGNPDRAQQQVVLADLAAKCGWNQVSSPRATSRTLWFMEGKRAAFGEIYSYLSLSPGDIEALENAVRHEAAAGQDDYV